MPPRRKTKNTATPHTISPNVTKSSEFILSSIRDPHNPKHCGPCLNGAFLECKAFERAINTRLPNKIPKQDPKFWDGILAFLLLKRTDKQLDRLLTRLSKCSCRKDDATIARYHEQGLLWAGAAMARMHTEEGESGVFTSNRCAFIIDIFCVLSTLTHDSGITSVAKGTSQSWPCHPTDLIPYGADSFVESMLQWYRFVPDTIIFHMTGLVLRICETLVIPSLVKYRFSHAVEESCRKLVDITMADFAKDLDDWGRMRLTQRFKFRVSDYATYFRNGFELKQTTPDCYAELMRGCETKVMQLCSIFLYLRCDPKMPSSDILDASVFILLGQNLFRFFHMHLYPRPRYACAPRGAASTLQRLPYFHVLPRS